MTNRITTLFDFKEQGSGLSRIKKDMTEANGAIGKVKAGWKSAIAEFRASPAAIAAVATTMAAFAGKAIADASNLEESVNAVNVAYGAAAEGVHELGETSSTSFGMSQRSFNEFAVQFSAFAKQIAKESGRDVVDVLEEMATRTADFASVQNLEMAEAGRIVMSTLAGETESFRRYGGDVSAATVKTYAYAEGIAESGTELTEQQKILARHGLFMEQTNNTAGDFKNTQDGLANSTRTLSAQMEDLSASIGGHLLPEVSAAVSDLTELAEVIDSLPGSGGVIDLGKEVLSWTNPIKQIKKPIDDLTDSWGDFKTGILGMSGPVGELRDDFTDAQVAIEKSIERAVAAQAEQAVMTDEQRVAAEAHGNALGTLAWELDQLRSNSLEPTTEATDDLAEAEKEAERAADDMRRAHTRLKDQLSDRSAFLGLSESFAAVAAEGGRSEQAVLDLRGQVADYINDVDGIPAATLTEIDALIIRGQLDEALVLLAEIERDRQARVDITTYYHEVGSSKKPVQSNRGGPRHTGGRVTPGQEIVPLSGEAFVADRPGRVVSREDLAGANGSAAPSLVVHAPITIQGEMTDPQALERTLRRAGATIGRTLNDVLEDYYRNGGRQPRSIR